MRYDNKQEVNKHMNKTQIVTAIGVLLVTGCATMSRAPEWTAKGAGAFKPNEKVFYGVGRADSSIRNESLRVETADNRARADLQRVFDTYSASLMKDYAGSDGELVERALKTFSAGHVSGGQVMDRYKDSKGTTYSLVKLDLESFKKAMELARELNGQAKDYIRKRADALFSELGKEETKRGIQ